MGEIDTEKRAALDRAENAEFAEDVLDRLLSVVGEFLRADATKLGLDHSTLAVLDVLGIVAPLSVAALAGRCSLSQAATARAVGRLVEQGYAERVTDEGDGRSSWWVGRSARADETLAGGRAGLRADLEQLAAQLPRADRLAGAAGGASDHRRRDPVRPVPAGVRVARDAVPTVAGAVARAVVRCRADTP